MNPERIQQYVAGRLGEEEAEAFENYCVANPEFAKQVELEQRLKAGIVQVASGNTAEFVRTEGPPRWKMALAAAASVLLAVSVGFLVWHATGAAYRGPVLAAMHSDASPRTNASLRLALVRGVEGTPTLPEGTVAVEIVGLFDSGSHYSVALDRLVEGQEVDTLATLYSQHPTTPVTLQVVVDGDQLAPGVYVLRVRKQSSDEESLDFGFLKP